METFDTELVARLRQGDREAFRIFVKDHQQQVFYLALSLTGNKQDAEDLCQEVFLRAFKALARFRGESKLSTWLHRITVNQFLDHKRRKHMQTVSLSGSENPGEDNMAEIRKLESASKTDEDAQRSELRHHIEQAMEQLTPRERSVFVLRHYQELPLREIGEMLEIAEGTVKALLYRAIRRMQKELAFYGGD
ncbi:MAG TPA: RNA polymerase sigma factor [Calditrichia bacterium]|nr:RNA polymerase sigma factor [Calditrichota bacterium]HQV30631.1 RNA polymerase sigma factor [Calditrichia bacterium]